MTKLKWLSLVALAGFALCLIPAPKANAQISLGVNIGAAPDCPYGYYDYAPYSCAPHGYYGPEWFTGGAFIGAGPWFHGDHDFHGHVNNHYDVHHGYKGPMPNRGDKVESARRPEAAGGFKGNEMRDGRGHTVRDKH